MSPTKNPPLTGKLPLKKQVVTRHLRELAATLTPGTRLPSVNELERTFGYANSTIEAALDELRREGVIVRRQGSGTFVADAAPMLPATFVNTNGTATLAPTRPTRLIALTANTRSALYQAEMLQRLEAELQGDEFAPVLVFEADAGRRFERLRQYARESGVLGYLHVGSTDYVANAGMPGVVIGEAPEGGDVSQVVVDNYRAGAHVGDYLWTLGHRRVLFLAGSSYTQIGERRLSGLRAAWEKRGGGVIPVNTLTSDQIYNANPEKLRDALEPFFDRADAPTAVFAVDDSVALQALRALHLLGLGVPEDVSVVGFNDCGTVASQVTPPLTTVRMPCAVLASLAVQVLREQILCPGQPPRRYRVPAELAVRESAGPAPATAVTVPATPPRVTLTTSP